MIRKKIIFFIAVLMMVMSITPYFVYAKKTIGDAPAMLGSAVGPTGVPKTDMASVIDGVIKSILTVVGVGFLALTVYAGVMWMSAQGKEETITKARGTIIAACIGLIIIVSAYALTSFVTTRIINAEGTVLRGGGPETDATGTQGCCLDKVQTDNPGSTPTWAWRITSQSDCEFRGNDANDPNDRLFGVVNGEQTWEFIQGVTDERECEKNWESNMEKL